MHGDDGLPTPPDEGTDWNNAYRYLADARDRADFLFGEGADEVQLWVAATDPVNPYLPDRSAADPDGSCQPGPCNFEATFTLRQGLKFYGGFAGGEQQASDRDPAENDTVLSGSIGNNTGQAGIAFSYHVLDASGVDESALVDGFTIVDGRATGPAAVAHDRGGGLRVGADAGPAVARCSFRGNRATARGGAIAIAGSAALYNCEFRGNAATGPTHGGGAIALDAAANTLDAVNCLFASNSGYSGGALYIAGPHGTQAHLANCTVVGNSAQSAAAGGIVASGGEPTDLTVANSIVWANTNAGPGDETAQISGDGAVAVGFSCIQDEDPDDGDVPFGGAANGNDDDDPRFADPDGPDNVPGNADDDFRLLPCSPLIDAGSPDRNLIPVDVLDLDNDQDSEEPTPDLDLSDRVLDGDLDSTDEVDMGAYELVQPGCPADLTGDGEVGTADLLLLLAQWDMECVESDFLPGPGAGTAELLRILADWGECPEGGGEVPTSVQDCLDRFDPGSLELEKCVCAIDPDCDPGQE